MVVVVIVASWVRNTEAPDRLNLVTSEAACSELAAAWARRLHAYTIAGNPGRDAEFRN